MPMRIDQTFDLTFNRSIHPIRDRHESLGFDIYRKFSIALACYERVFVYILCYTCDNLVFVLICLSESLFTHVHVMEKKKNNAGSRNFWCDAIIDVRWYNASWHHNVKISNSYSHRSKIFFFLNQFKIS